jgi:hypothetical protein
MEESIQNVAKIKNRTAKTSLEKDIEKHIVAEHRLNDITKLTNKEK